MLGPPVRVLMYVTFVLHFDLILIIVKTVCMQLKSYALSAKTRSSIRVKQ
jgi:hypothetical protein